MILLTILALVGGIFVGSVMDSTYLSWMVDNAKFMLYALMFFVGISIGLHKGIVAEIKRHHFKIFLIPIGIIVGSLIGGVLCSFLINHSLRDSLAIVSGLGWYSLAGVNISDLAGAEMGSIAFISNLLREVLSFVLIPILAKYFNEYTCIAPAGATSEDTTLPMLMKYTSPTIVVMAIFNGVICSLAAPILISLCYV